MLIIINLLLLTSSSKCFAKTMNYEFEMSMMRELTSSLAFKKNQTNEDIFLSQIKYTKKVIKIFGIETVLTCDSSNKLANAEHD